MSVIPGVHLMQFGWRSLPLVSTQFPCMALVLQGTKSVEFGGQHLEYGAGQYLLASVHVPAASKIVNASKNPSTSGGGRPGRLRRGEGGNPAL